MGKPFAPWIMIIATYCPRMKRSPSCRPKSFKHSSLIEKDYSHVWCKECATQVLLLCSYKHNSEKLPHRSTMVDSFLTHKSNLCIRFACNVNARQNAQQFPCCLLVFPITWLIINYLQHQHGWQHKICTLHTFKRFLRIKLSYSRFLKTILQNMRAPNLQYAVPMIL